MRLFPAPGPWSILAPIGIRRLSSSNELGAQHVLPHQTTKRKEITPESRVPACPSFVIWCAVSVKLLQEKKVSGSSERLHMVDTHFGEEPWDHWNSGTDKRLKNLKADCCTLLKRITKLKCVNSEVRSVDIYPTEEVASLGPMAPCRSHHRNHTR